MTEIVIRFDPARTLRNMRRVADGIMRSLHKPTVRRFVRTHVKFGVGAVSATILIYGALLAFTPSEFERRLDQSWEDTKKAGSLHQSDMDRAARMIEITKQRPLESFVVKTERLVFDMPSQPPPAVTPPAATTPMARLDAPDEGETIPVKPPRRYTQSTRGGDICARHGLKKVITRGGKSWRCGKR